MNSIFNFFKKPNLVISVFFALMIAFVGLTSSANAGPLGIGSTSRYTDNRPNDVATVPATTSVILAQVRSTGSGS